VDCDAPGVLPGEGFDNDGVMASVAHGKVLTRRHPILPWANHFS
jgi:hypothetical protein